MSYQGIFERHELKYVITQNEKEKLYELMKQYMEPDEFWKSDIRNIYYDTPTKEMIRTSLDKPEYKEKLRVRSYGTASPDSHVFIEIKKKYKGIVYKRRMAIPERTATTYLTKHIRLKHPTQISKEIDYLKYKYEGIEPSMFLAYEREAYKSKTDPNFRMTFDEKIITRKYDLSLTKEVYGEQDMLGGDVILEVKTAMGIPQWLVDFFSENAIYKASFSKYGNAYLDTMLKPYLEAVRN